MGASQTKPSSMDTRGYQYTSSYTPSKGDFRTLPCNFVKDWLLTVENTQQISERELNQFVWRAPFTVNNKRLQKSDVIDCIDDMNSGKYGYLDSRIQTPITIITADEFLCKHVQEWIKTVPDRQRITDEEVKNFIKKFNEEIDPKRKYYDGWLYDKNSIQPCIDKINETLPEDEPPIGFLSSIPKHTPIQTRSIEKPKEQYYSNPLVALQAFNQLDAVDGINLLPYIDREVRLNLNMYGNYSKSIDEELHELKIGLAPLYAKILILFLKTFKKNLRIDLASLCSEILEILEVIFLEKTYTNKIFRYAAFKSSNERPKNTLRYDGLFMNDSDVEKFSNTYPDTAYVDLANKQDIINTISKYIPRTRSQLKQIKEEFSRCKNQYYIIPYATKRLATSGHQNLIILDKLNQHVIYIEPAYYANTEFGKYMTSVEKYRVDRILEELELTNYTKILPVTPYPQSIAEDKNCMFWTFLITVTFLLNPQAKTPDEVANAIIKKYPDQQSLIKYIEGFRLVLSKFIEVPMSAIQTGSKRRKTYRKKKGRKSKTQKSKH